MRILLVSTYVWPEPAGNAPYVSGVAEHFAEVGHDVTVLAGYPHYPEWRVTQTRRPVTRQRHAGYQILRRAHTVPRNPTLRRRAGYEAGLLAGAAAVLPLCARPDVVIAFVPAFADALAGRLAATVWRVPFGIVFQDLLGLAAEEVHSGRARVVSRVLGRLERWLARSADAVGYVSPGFRTHLNLSGTANVRLHNWSTYTEPAGTRAESRALLGWPEDVPVCVHAGNLGEKQGLETVVAAARIAPEIRFVFVGEGSQRASLEVLAAGCANIEFAGRAADARYSAALYGADALILCQRPEVRRMSLPSKLAAYQASGTAIVAAVAPDSEAAQMLACDPRTRCVSPGDPAALAAALRGVVKSQPGAEPLVAEVCTEREQALGGYDSLLHALMVSRQLATREQL
jgi:glycosyltransferase involved in cell wall biosynthesis